MVIESAADRMLRILVVALGIGSLAFTLIGLPEIIAAHGRMMLWYTAPVYALFLGIPPVLASLAYVLPANATRVVLVVHASISVLVFVFWIPALDPSSAISSAVPWIQNIFAIACVSAALTLPYTASIAYTLVMSALAGIDRFGTYGGGDPSPALQDALYGLLFCATLVTLMQLSRRAAALQDVATRTAEAESTRTSTAEAVERQRRRYQDFIRDEVRSVFQSAMAAGPVPSTDTRVDASRVLAQLTELQSETATVSSLGVAELRTMLEGAAESKVAIGLSTSTGSGPSAPTILVPYEVADAITAAFGEAVRNSVRHAGDGHGRPVLRRAWITASPDRVEVTMSDDGLGFNPTRIPIDRMGVRVGILGVMERVPGGRAEITASRGRGSSVALIWERGAQ